MKEKLLLALLFFPVLLLIISKPVIGVDNFPTREIEIKAIEIEATLVLPERLLPIGPSQTQKIKIGETKKLVFNEFFLLLMPDENFRWPEPKKLPDCNFEATSRVTDKFFLEIEITPTAFSWNKYCMQLKINSSWNFSDPALKNLYFKEPLCPLKIIVSDSTSFVFINIYKEELLLMLRIKKVFV